MKRMKREHLGEITSPSGAIVLVDLGTLGMWSGDALPLMPDWAAPPDIVEMANAAADYVTEGPDAEAAARIFGLRPPYLYDRSANFEETFAETMAERGLEATLAKLPDRVSHARRLELSLDTPARAGVVEYHGLWAPCAAGLPRDRRLAVTGIRMGSGEFRDLWRNVELVVRPDLPVARTEVIGDVLVDRARLAFLDPLALAAWEHDAAIDGLADCVFWGRDAEAAAAATGAGATPEGFGWLDLPVERAVALAEQVEAVRERDDLKMALDFRPHSHHYEIMKQVRDSDTESGTLDVGGATLCAFMTSWGDGCFHVERDVGAGGELVALRVAFDESA